jgi:hypothetical protein
LAGRRSEIRANAGHRTRARGFWLLRQTLIAPCPQIVAVRAAPAGVP